MPERMTALTGWLKEKAPRRRRRQLAEARVRINGQTSRWRTLPNLLIVGAQRSGTSSLYKYLGAHPQVAPSLRKETDFFSVRYPEGEHWYRAHFPFTRLAPAVVFEATPDYLLDPRSAARAASLIPEAKIIAMVRNPIDRAFSQYHHNRRLGQEPLEFGEALDAEGERLDGEVERLAVDPEYLARRLRRYSYVTRGMYADQLPRWSEHYPNDRVLVLRFEDFVADPASALIQVEQFLGIDEWTPEEFGNHSYGRAGRAPGPVMEPHLRDRLAQTFQPANLRLEAWLGRDLGWDGAESPRKSP